MVKLLQFSFCKKAFACLTILEVASAYVRDGPFTREFTPESLS